MRLALSMIVDTFTDEANTQEIISQQSDELNDIRDELKNTKKALVDLCEVVKKQKIEHIHNNYYKNVVEDSTRIEEFKKASKYSYWYVHYEDQGLQGFIVCKIKGNTFN